MRLFLSKGSFPRVFFRMLGICIIISGLLLTGFMCARPVSPELKTLLETKGSGDTLTPHLSLHSKPVMDDFYQKSNYSFIWLTPDLKPKPVAYIWISIIRRCYTEGLNPADYHLEQIEDSLTRIIQEPGIKTNKGSASSFDLLLSDAFIIYAKHQYAGRVHTATENTEWEKHIAAFNPADYLKQVAEGKDIKTIIQSFSCQHRQYKLLHAKLVSAYENSIFSPADEDDADTIIQQIALNMERWRWMPRQMPELYIMVNIADFSLTVTHLERDTLNMKIIAGKREQPTPVFDAKLSYLILNPWWEIPEDIARKEMLPQMRKDPSYLSRNHIGIFDPKDLKEIVPGTISPDQMVSNHFPYKLRQRPGPWNALGEVKFIFPNKYDIYFHDTPNRELFARDVRTFSHGCIRIEKPLELAAYLLNKDVSWVRNRIDSRKTQMFVVRSQPMIYLCYWTAWVDEEGELHTAPDIYKYDRKLAKSGRYNTLPLPSGRKSYPAISGYPVKDQLLF